MSHAVSSKEGAAYLIDPLNAPEPSQECGPGTHFGSVMATANADAAAKRERAASTSKKPAVAATTTPLSPTSSISSNNPYRKSSISSSHGGHSRNVSREIGSGSPSSPRAFPKYREAAFSDLNEGRRRSGSGGDHTPPEYVQSNGVSGHRRRTSSLTARYPGDDSHKPLDVIRRDSKKAHRSPHLQRRHIPGADSIDRLDPTMNSVPYHHEGPFDAALLARNTSFDSSPVAAVAESNREALKATPAEKIQDSLERHQPLEGVASVPPGTPDRLGRVYNYEEGTDMMRDPNAPGGPYKQWPGIDYHKDDLKGKGEPAFSLDRALKAHTIQERDIDGNRGYEMSSQPLMSGRRSGDRKSLDTRDPVEIAGDDRRYADLQYQAGHSRSASGSSSKDVQSHVTRTSSLRKAGEGLKKRLSIKKKFREIHDGAVD